MAYLVLEFVMTPCFEAVWNLQQKLGDPWWFKVAFVVGFGGAFGFLGAIVGWWAERLEAKR